MSFLVSFNAFNEAITNLRRALNVGFYKPTAPALVSAFDAASAVIKEQYNVTSIYVLMESCDNGCPEDSNTHAVGYFRTREHAVRAGQELAMSRGVSFVDGHQDLKCEGYEMYIIGEDFHA